MLPKLIILHGLNNNSTTWNEFDSVMKERGFNTLRLTLPGHGEIRDEGQTFELALKKFDETLSPHVNEPYVVVAYSLGALFFANWLMGRKENLPQRMVFLAPALFLRGENILRLGLDTLHPNLPIPSIAPRDIMLHKALYVWEYRNLFGGLDRFQADKNPVTIPNFVMLDPKDELVDAQKLKAEWNVRSPESEVVFLERPHQKWGPSNHHILFHSKYFTKEEWDFFIGKIEHFLKL